MYSDTFTLYKLIVLYMLSKIDFPISNARLSDFMLERDYTTYFNLQQVLSELEESDLVTCKTIRNSSYYRITNPGREILNLFDDKVSNPIKRDVLAYLDENNYKLLAESSTLSDYKKINDNEFLVTCKVLERTSTIIEINLSVPSEEESVIMCNNWEKKSQEIYSSVILSLLNN